jgi:membrane associated rhomboid family serine protease
MVLPEELPGMEEALHTARSRWIQADLERGNYKLRTYGMALACWLVYLFYNGLTWATQHSISADLALRLKFAFKALLDSTSAGLALLGFVIFAFIPWYQGRKQSKELAKWTPASIVEATPTIRFETWLGRQQAPVTQVILGLITVVGLVQLLPSDGLTAAGLLKDRYQQGDWWRLLTAPFLHGNIVHFLMNAAGLLYLGKRLEVFARWPHLPLVFLFAACIGGEASARLVAAPSVGASGGLMGWLGFLIVFETLHRGLVPRSARRRLAAGVALTTLIGLIGYRYIDNAAHAGGLAAGMLYAAIVFPTSSSLHRPRSHFTDRLAGGAALLVLITAAAVATYRVVIH